MLKSEQIEHSDLWLTETTTPGLLMQTDVNSGETEPVFAGAATPRQAQGQDSAAPGLLLELAVLQRRNCAEFDELLRPITEARTTSSAAEAHAYFFGAGSVDQREQAKRLRILANGLEAAAIHIRQVLFDAT